MSKSTLSNSMRVYHRYLGFFLAGIMAIYALSGIILIFRDTNFLKREKQVSQQVKPGMNAEDLGKAIRIRELKIVSVNGNLQSFKQGTYDVATGAVNYTTKSLAPFCRKTHPPAQGQYQRPAVLPQHIFSVYRCCFLLSPASGCLCPKQVFFKKGLLFTLAGLVLALVMLFL